jgi:hypothetical protein
VTDGIERARESAAGAVTAAENGEERTANERLSGAVSSLRRVRDALATETQAGYGDDAVAVIDPKALAGIERANAAVDAPL